MVHTSFIYRDMRLPLNAFTHGILTYYGLQLHHLTPNGVLHIAFFITPCECFLGTAPHFGHLRYFFELLQHMKGGWIPTCGGAAIQPHPDSHYNDLPMVQEKKG